MRERRAFPRRLTLVLTLAAMATVVHARGLDPSRTPTRYLGNGLDSGLVTATSPVDGRVWTAWAYRSGAESDIAVSVRDASGAWTEPVFLGAGDGRNQVDPALVFDASGTLYLAHSVRETGHVLVARLPVGSTRMTSPVLVSVAGEKAHAPTLLLTDRELIVGYRVGTRVVLRTVPLAPTQTPFGIQDGPDGFPPTNNQTPTGISL